MRVEAPARQQGGWDRGRGQDQDGPEEGSVCAEKRGQEGGRRSQDRALLCPLAPRARSSAPETRTRPLHRLPQRQVENLLNAPPRHGAHLGVRRAYPLRDGRALFGRDRVASLCAQERLARSSVRRSVLVAMRTMGVSGQKCDTSGYHCAGPRLLSGELRPLPRWCLEPGEERGTEGREAHLVLDVLERGRVVDGEADEEHVRLRVAEGSQAVVFFLAGRVPQCKLDNLVAVSLVEDAARRRRTGGQRERSTFVRGAQGPGRGAH